MKLRLLVALLAVVALTTGEAENVRPMASKPTVISRSNYNHSGMNLIGILEMPRCPEPPLTPCSLPVLQADLNKMEPQNGGSAPVDRRSTEVSCARYS